MPGVGEGLGQGRAAPLLGMAAIALIAAMLAPPRADADFHLMVIREFKDDSVLASDQFIELQMYAAGQTQVQGHYLRTYDAMGNTFQTFSFPHDVSNGGNQRTILVGGPDIADANKDFEWDFTLPSSGGALCFLDTVGVAMATNDIGIDCVSWGTFDGFTQGPDPSPITGNAPAPTSTQSLERSIAAGCSTLLEASDDTDNSSDFTLDSTPSPRPNSTAPTEATCAGPEPEPGPGPGPSPKVFCGGLEAKIVGGPGSDLVKGGPKRDVVATRGGADTIRGLGGNDVLCGGKGRDRLLGGRGRDRLLGQAGRDTCNGGARRDRARRCELRKAI